MNAAVVVAGVMSAITSLPALAQTASRQPTRPSAAPLTVADSAAPKDDVSIQIEDRYPEYRPAHPEGTLDGGQVDRVVKSHLPLLEYCYQRDPSLPRPTGAVTVKFQVERDGHVSRTKVLSSTLRDDAVSRCVAARFKLLRFPSPGATAVILSYPVLIATAGR